MRLDRNGTGSRGFAELLALCCLMVFSPVRSDAALLNQGRFGLAAVVVDDAIYVVGGYARGGPVGSIERIDPATGEAEMLSATVLPRFFHHAVLHEDRIIIYGGYAPGTEAGRLVESFDPRTGEVTELTHLPRARKWPRGWVIEDRLYVFGGSPAQRAPVAEVDIYDFTTGTWSEGASKPTPTEAAVFERGGRIYAVAGYDGLHGTTVFEVYDPASDTWESLASLPIRTSAHSVTLVGDRLYVMGDYHQVSRTMVYDFASGEWGMMNLDYNPSRHHAAVWHQDALWVIGGNVDSRTRLEWIQRFSAAELAQVSTRAVLPVDDLTDLMTRGVSTVPPGQHPLSDILQGWAEALAKIEGIQIRWFRHHEHPLMGELGAPTLLCEFVYAGPQRYSLFLPEHQLVIEANADGLQLRSGVRKAHYAIPPEADPQAWVGLLETLNIPLDIAAFMVPDPRAYMEHRVRLQQWRVLEETTESEQSIMRMRLAGQPPFLATRGQGGYVDIDTETGLWMAAWPAGDEPEDEVDMDDPLAALLGPPRTRVAADSLKESPDALSIRSAARQEGDTAAANVMEVYRRPAGTCGARTRASVADADALINAPAPPFSLTLLDGSTFDLAEHRGKVVVIDFWATWCGPCVRALPHMRTLAEAFADDDVVVLGISRDRAGQEQPVRQVLEQHGISYPNGIDVDNIGPRYGVRGIPNVVLVDRDGIIRSRKVGFSERSMHQLQAEIRAWLEKDATRIEGVAP